LLSAAAIVAVLRFKTGTLPTLAATSLAGVGLYLGGVIA
jgi:chromate transporter